MATDIPGWMDERELAWLAEQARTHYRIVEVGSYLGRSTTVLAKNTTGFVVAVDDWLGPRDTGEVYDSMELIRQFHENTKGLNIQSIRSDSTAPHLASTPHYDMVFLDADHSYESVKRDILAWLPRIVKGGMICGHDYGTQRFGVTEAVRELLPHHKLVPNTLIWYAEVR